MANVQYYDVILKPVVTEKSMNAMAEKKYKQDYDQRSSRENVRRNKGCQS
jgi:ribosomal protein L23